MIQPLEHITQAPALDVGFEMTIISDPGDDYHIILDTLMRSLLTRFGTAHAAVNRNDGSVMVYAHTPIVPDDADFKALQHAMDEVNRTYYCVRVSFL